MAQNIYLKNEPNLAAKHQAFGYQTSAVKTIQNMEYAAIFHEQGLGKSKIAIDLLLFWLDAKEVDTVLLVVKKGLVNNWIKELKNHTHISPILISNDYKSNHEVFNCPARLILTHYEAVKAEQKRIKTFLKTRNVSVILDESTKIKNPESSLTKVFFDLSNLFKKRIILTGTPVANRPYDIWAQVFFLDHGKSLGNKFDDFKKRLELDNKLYKDEDRKKEFEKNLDEINNLISKFTVRENKQSENIKLPEKKYINILCDWEDDQKKIYDSYRFELKNYIKKDDLIIEDNAEEIIKRLIRLVQAASNPSLIDEDYKKTPGKFLELTKLVNKIIANEEKVIIWSNFTQNIDFFHKSLDQKTVRIHGKLSMEERNNSVEKFLNDFDTRILLATPGAAKEGLTLTVANHAIFFDRGFSLDDYLQAQDRIHRVSQIKTCYIYLLKMMDSIDLWVDRLLEAKSLSAKLAQGDITFEEYKSNADYSFGEILNEIINTDDKF
jgi:SNF2 family DNA or RNA helicase